MDYKKELKNAEAELLKLEQQKLNIERQMHGWVRVIEGFRVLSERPGFGDIPTREKFVIEQETPSLPSSILAVLATVNAPIGATQIRDQLIANRCVDASAKNLLINIHTTLKRLIPDQIEEVLLEDGSKLYRFIPPMERAIKEGVFVGRARTLDAMGTKIVAKGTRWTNKGTTTTWIGRATKK